jgi:hypothetical protein
MNLITIDEISYEIDTLSNAARRQLANVQVTDAEIQRLKSLLAIATTARAAYAAALKDELPPNVAH